jgi:acyl-CoA thioester hydrolase
VAEPFVHELRVRYVECDAQGVVFNSHYLAYVDVGITELWRAAFGSYQAMLEHGVDVVVAEATLRFRGSARFDDMLTIEVSVEHLGNTSIVTDHRITRAGELLVDCKIRHVMVERETLTKTPLPEWVREGLSRWRAPTAGAVS